MARGVLLILEGADCSGKTTLANAIVDFCGKDNCDYMHSTWFKGMDVLSHHRQNLTRAIHSLTKRDIVIIDRHWISECVYGSEYRDGCSYNPREHELHRKIEELGGQYILCIPDRDVQLQRHRERKEQDGEMFSDISGVIDRYRNLWYGKNIELSDRDHAVNIMTRTGGVSDRRNWHMYDWQKHADHLPEFIRSVIQGVRYE